METFGPFLLGLVVAAGVLIPLFLRSRAVANEVATEVESLEQDLKALKKSKALLEEDQKFLTQFMKDFPHLARDLFTGLKERQVPTSVLHVVQKSLDPEKVLVLVKRGTGERRFVVAAAAPEAGPVRVGAEIPMDTGEIGFAAEARIVVGRDDLQDETAKGRIKPGPSPLAGFVPELFAPLVFDQETLGLVVMSKPRKSSGEVKAALRLIAQTGAQALHNAAAYTQIKVTAEMDGLTRIFNKKHMEQTPLRADLSHRLRRLRPARPGGQLRPGPDPLGLPLRHRPLQELQRHQRAPGGGQAAAGALAAGAGDDPQGRHLRPLRGRGVPAHPAQHQPRPGHRRGEQDPRAHRRASSSPSPTASP